MHFFLQARKTAEEFYKTEGINLWSEMSLQPTYVCLHKACSWGTYLKISSNNYFIKEQVNFLTLHWWPHPENMIPFICLNMKESPVSISLSVFLSLRPPTYPNETQLVSCWALLSRGIKSATRWVMSQLGSVFVLLFSSLTLKWQG